MYDKETIIEKAMGMLTPKRHKHTLGVIETALKLAEHYGGDKEKIEIACACHDIFRGKYGEDLNEIIIEYGLPEMYLNNSNLAHGKLAAIHMKEKMGIDDSDILNAVSYHTTGRPGMSLTEKIVFVADAIEPGRDYPGVDEIRNVAFSDLDKACLLSLSGTVDHLKKSGMKEEEIGEDTLKAVEYFKKKEITE